MFPERGVAFSTPPFRLDPVRRGPTDRNAEYAWANEGANSDPALGSWGRRSVAPGAGRTIRFVEKGEIMFTLKNRPALFRMAESRVTFSKCT